MDHSNERNVIILIVINNLLRYFIFCKYLISQNPIRMLILFVIFHEENLKKIMGMALIKKMMFPCLGKKMLFF